jgi:MazG family protein
MGRYLLEEVSEAVDAIHDADGRPEATVREELGDVLMNVVLAARIAEDEGGFDLGDVAKEITEKLIRRHPHVFGDRAVNGVEDVLKNWNEIKEEEKRGDPEESEAGSRLDGVPRSLPVLERAHQLSREAAKAGFDWPDARGAYEKVLEEAEEVRALLESADSGTDSPSERLESELGDLLFAAANLSRKLDVAPEVALRKTLKKFCQRFRAIERTYPDLESRTLEEMEAVWQDAKGRSSALSESAENSTGGEARS